MSETISLVLGAILPPIIDLLTKKVSNDKVRFGISMAVCVLVGIVINYQTFDVKNILGSVGLVFASAQIVYNTYWKNASLRSPENKGN